MAYSAISNALSRKFREQKLDVTVEMWTLLNSLWNRDGQMQMELARECYRDKSSITRIIENLIERNLVVKIPDRIDKRSNLIYLTKAGKDLRIPLTACVEEVLADAFQGISASEAGSLLHTLKKLFDNLNPNWAQ
jgi:DNA-binding MarR family transcriptional regulator